MIAPRDEAALLQVVYKRHDPARCNPELGAQRLLAQALIGVNKPEETSMSGRQPEWDEALCELRRGLSADLGQQERRRSRAQRRSGPRRAQQICRGGFSHRQYDINIESFCRGTILPVATSKTLEDLMAGQKPLGRAWLDDAWSDVRFASRTLRHRPTFLVFVLVTLGLGIGANTSMFTLINTLVLNPLPVARPSELAAVVDDPHGNAAARALLPLSYPNLQGYQRENVVFESLAGYTSPRVLTWQHGGLPERLFGELVTGNYFATLGLQPALGRFFSLEEDMVPGGHPIAVMNYATWQTRFGGSPDVLGQAIRVNNVVLTVIGIAPPRFIGVNAIFGPDLWVPASMAEALFPNEMGRVLIDRAKGTFLGIGRLRTGTSRARAQANMTAIAASLAREYPEANKNHGVSVRPIADILFGASGPGSTSLVFASVGLVVVVVVLLAIACSNLVNLMLARAMARGSEVAVRIALGATRARLIRQWLTESALLGVLGGAVGAGIGYVGVKLLWSFRPAEVAANLVSPHLDWSVLAYTFVVAAATGIFVGIAPAVRASQIEISEKLKEESRSVGRQRRRVTLANMLLVAQVACSFLLLATAILFLRSMQHAYDVDPGFQTKRLVVVLTNPGQAGYTKARTSNFYKAVRERVSALPGVESVSWASNLPLWGRLASGLRIEGHEPRSQADTVSTIVNTVDANYFETAGIPMTTGRAFTTIDVADSFPVVVINEKVARDFWPGHDALGKRIQLPGEKFERQVIGVARTANYSTLAEPPQYCVYVPLEQSFSDAMTLYVRTRGEPGPLMAAIQREIRTAGPSISVNDMRTGRTIIDNALFQVRMGVMLLGVFGILALALASIGLYGVLAFSVAQRTREIGVRMALGAARGRVLHLILGEGMSVVAVGVLIGLIASLLSGRLLNRLLYGIGAADPISLAAASCTLLAAAALACYWPARRASRLDPLVALRQG